LSGRRCQFKRRKQHVFQYGINAPRQNSARRQSCRSCRFAQRTIDDDVP
jgi:hypothetical protein